MIGRFAESFAGHDAGTIYVIIGIDEKKVMLCDGKIKKFSHPKVKNIKHVTFRRESVSEEVRKKITEHAPDADEAIKRAIKLYSRDER